MLSSEGDAIKSTKELLSGENVVLSLSEMSGGCTESVGKMLSIDTMMVQFNFICCVIARDDWY